MIKWDELALGLLGGTDSSVEIKLERLKGASILWTDPDFCLINPDACFLERVAVAAHHQSAKYYVVGRVDRYGGTGIGTNGGAGRAAIVNGLYLKGIGTTPLIGKGSHISHSSGVAYLEECARELALACVLSAELPYGALLPVCIVARAEEVSWQTQQGLKHKTCAILARKPFIRPAHFVRANGYEPVSGVNEFSIDCRRVEANIQLVRDAIGDDCFISALEDCFTAAAHQFAYASAWNITLGGVSLSNIDLGAKVVDFGGVGSMPYWGAFGESAGSPLSNSALSSLATALDDLFSDLRRYSSISTQKLSSAITRTHSAIASSYYSRLHFEILRVMGFTSRQSDLVLKSENSKVLLGLERIKSQMARYAGDLDSSWGNQNGEVDVDHCELVEASVSLLSTSGCGNREEIAQLAKRRRIFRKRSRPELSRRQLNDRLYLALNRDGQGHNRESFSELIRNIVIESRRDLRCEFEDAYEVGVTNSMEGLVFTFATVDGKLRRLVVTCPL